MDKDKIIKLLQREIDNINENNIESSQLKKEIIELKNVISKLQKIIDTPKEIINLNLEEISKYTSTVTKEVEEKIGFYQFIFQHSNDLIKITENQINYIKDFINNIIFEISKKIKEIEIQIEKNKKTKEIEEINDLIKKVNGLDENAYFGANDLEELKKILDKYISTDLSIEEYIEIIINITNASIKNITKNELDLVNEDNIEEIEDVIEVNNSEDNIINLLKKYNYDFNVLKNKNRELILKFGNVDNMDSILSILKKNNIRINISSRENQFATLLTLSNSQIVNTIIGNIAIDIKNEDITINEIFDDYLDEISLFIKGKRIYKKLGKGGHYNDKKYVVGGFDHYIKNREFLLSKGINNINDIMKKCSSSMVITHNTFVSKFKAFELYNIPVSTIASTFSCMKAAEPLTMLDHYIEVGCFDYVLSNFSKVVANDSIIYRIIKAKQNGLTNDELYRHFDKKVVLPSEITVDKIRGYGIDRTNGPTVIGQYYPDFSPKYSEIIMQGDNNGPLVLVYNNFFIKRLEEMCKEDDYRYNFNGVIISRFKVLRYYETMIKKSIAGTVDSIMYAICKDSIITEEQFKTIKDCVDKIFNYGRSYRI